MASIQLFARMVRNPENWSRPPEPWIGLPSGCLHDLGDSHSCPSLFRVSGNDELITVAAALNLGLRKVQGHTFLMMDDQTASACGKAPVAQAGTTGNPEADLMHFQLLDLSAGELASFLQAVYDKCGGNPPTGDVLSVGRFALRQVEVAARLNKWHRSGRHILKDRLLADVEKLTRVAT